jgi:hypothetical protein
MNDLSGPLNVVEYEELARQKMQPAAWDYIAAGAEDEVTLARNRSAFECIALRPNPLVDVEQVDTATTVLGQAVSTPILIAPMGQHGFVCPDAELARFWSADRCCGVLRSTGRRVPPRSCGCCRKSSHALWHSAAVPTSPASIGSWCADVACEQR